MAGAGSLVEFGWCSVAWVMLGGVYWHVASGMWVVSGGVACEFCGVCSSGGLCSGIGI